MYEGRQERIRQTVLDERVQAMIVQKPENIQYLSGFSGTTSILVVGRARSVLVADGRYLERAREEAISVEVSGATNVWSGLEQVLVELGTDTALYEGQAMTVESLDKFTEGLKRRRKRIKLEPASRPVESLREVKDEFELSMMEEACRITSEAFGYVTGTISAGVTELEIAAELYCFMHRNGVDKPAFEMIVASGARSAMPHAAPSHKEVAKGDLVLIDMGVSYEGYYSDMTRTFVAGKASDEQKAVYKAVKEAQILGIDALKPGVTGADVDAASRDYLVEQGYGERFLHGLGHGVGLEVHERPSLAPGRADPILENMVFTIEPGIYISGMGGVRIEDTVAMGETVPRIMTSYTKSLVEL